MRVSVDPTKCLAHGLCADLCPSIFVLDEWGYATTSEADGSVEPDSVDAAREAIDGCPERAISEIQQQ